MTARLTLPECRAADNAAYGPEEQQEYEAVRDAFRRLVKWWENSAERKDLIEEIITLRASFLIDKACVDCALILTARWISSGIGTPSPPPVSNNSMKFSWLRWKT